MNRNELLITIYTDNRKNGSPNTKEILQALEQCKLTSGHSVEHTPMPSPYTTIEKNKKS